MENPGVGYYRDLLEYERLNNALLNDLLAAEQSRRAQRVRSPNRARGLHQGVVTNEFALSRTSSPDSRQQHQRLARRLTLAPPLPA